MLNYRSNRELIRVSLNRELIRMSLVNIDQEIVCSTQPASGLSGLLAWIGITEAVSTFWSFQKPTINDRAQCPPSLAWEIRG